MRRRQYKQRRTRRGGDENVAPNLETGSNVSADVFKQGRTTLKKPVLGIKTPQQTAHEFQKVQLKTTPKAGKRTRRRRRNT